MYLNERKVEHNNEVTSEGCLAKICVQMIIRLVRHRLRSWLEEVFLQQAVVGKMDGWS